jgi:caa(3)-type oxidase subunit IV
MSTSPMDGHALDEHDDPDQHGDVFKAYLAVFCALSVFTAMSFVVNLIFGIGSVTGASIIMGVAVVKAVLVGFIFMHLKWDWYKLYFMIVPAFIVGTMMIIVLLPDIVLAWR